NIPELASHQASLHAAFRLGQISRPFFKTAFKPAPFVGLPLADFFAAIVNEVKICVTETDVRMRFQDIKLRLDCLVAENVIIGAIEKILSAACGYNFVP